VTKISADHIPKLIVRDEQNDVSTQLRIQQIANGFVVRSGGDPIFYPNIEEVAEAVRLGILQIQWPIITRKTK